eukprot:TRINITY_DN10266_c0_g2_i4.p1 TRINITY_DN10266_c0_g2~~TRINITY_DN10266_c0_g2_i4.p1  ORF type:complete len:225 (-),score=25.59 TRINITY_DN10266_c0_g2_i4:319-993(-)
MMKMTTKAGVVLVAAAVVLAAWCPCVVGQVTQPAVLLRDFGNAMYIGHTRSLGSVAFNPSNPNELLSASEDGTLRLWDKGSGHTIRIFANSVGPVSQPLVPVYVAVFNPTDPNEILSGSEVDRYQSLPLRLWDKFRVRQRSGSRFSLISRWRLLLRPLYRIVACTPRRISSGLHRAARRRPSSPRPCYLKSAAISVVTRQGLQNPGAYPAFAKVATYRSTVAQY